MYLLRLIKVTRVFLRFIKTQHKFNDHFIDGFLSPFYKLYNTELSPPSLHKIRKYYCIGVPVVCAAYTKVYGRDLSEEERKNAVLGGILTPLIDDFTDNKQLAPEQVENLISFPVQYHPSSLEEEIVKQILCTLREEVTSPEGFIYSCKRTLIAQKESEKQFRKDISEDEIPKITMEKGGWALIVYHYFIREVPAQQTIDVIYQMGGVLQITHDIFDLYKDVHEGISTLASICSDYKQFEEFYRTECIRFFTMARKLPYKKSDIEFFIVLFANIMARGIVALRRLGRLQYEMGGGVLPFDKIERKQLICDMDKPLNLLKMIWHAHSIMRE